MSGEAIYHALTQKDGPKVRELCKKHHEGPFQKLTQRKDSVLQKALYSTQVELVLQLLDDAEKRWGEAFFRKLGEHSNTRNNNVLHVAATHDSCIPAAAKILEYEPHLITLVNDSGESPIFIAVRYGQFNMFKYLNHQIKKLVPDMENRLSFYYKVTNEDKSQTILHQAIHNEHFGIFLSPNN